VHGVKLPFFRSLFVKLP